MIINFQKLKTHAFAWAWRRDQRVLLIGLWFFAVGFDLGLKRSAWWRHFNRACGYCGEPLTVTSREQRMFWHGACRTAGRAEERAVAKAARRARPARPSFWDRLLGRGAAGFRGRVQIA